jgi:hypothetical protein
MATKSERKIGLWLDQTGDPSDPKWIVSMDDESGSDTVKIFEEDDYELAKAHALAMGKQEKLPVVESNENGQEEGLYYPPKYTDKS